VKFRWAMMTALATALVLGTAGCTFGARIATNIPYEPSDGVGTTVGDIAVRNALLITEDGSTLNLVVTFVNSSDSDRAITVQWQGEGGRESDRVIVNANRAAILGGPEQRQILIEGVEVIPGALFPLFFQYGDQPGMELLVPVLDGSLPEYELYVPAT
jgi:hypothetical protein